MFIKQIIDRDEISGEMDIIISDGKFELLCYCAQSNNSFPSEVKELETFLSDKIMLANNNNYCANKTDGYYSYHLQGKVLECKQPMISIGEIHILLDTPLPKDIKKNDFIECFVQRIDCRIY